MLRTQTLGRISLVRMVLLGVLVFLIGSITLFRPSSNPANSTIARAQTAPVVITQAQHPRLWITPARLAVMKREAAANSSRWAFTKKQADTGVSMVAQALAYQVTGNVTYCQKAIPNLVKFTTTFSRTRDQSYDYRNLYDIAAVYDWCHDQMTPADITTVANWAMDVSYWIFPDTNPAQAHAWGVADPGSNYFHGFLSIFPVAIAALGDDPRAQNLIDLGMNKYQMLQTFFNGKGAGGLFYESTNYDQLSEFNVGRFLDAYDTATATPANPNGLDLINGSKFLRDSIYFGIHYTTPDGRNFLDLGDAPRISSEPVSALTVIRTTISAALVNDASARADGKFWIDSHFNANDNTGDTIHWMFVYYDSSAPSSDYKKTQPTSYFSPGIGAWINRSDWTKDAQYSEIWKGPLDENHQSNEELGFQIWKNGWLAGNANKWSHDGERVATIYHNTLTFGGKVQSHAAPGAPPAYDHGTDYNVFQGQAANFYNAPKKVVNDFFRTFIEIPSIGTYIVHDNTDIVDPTLPKEFNLHSLKQATINGRSYSIDNNNAQLCGQSVLPANGTTLSNQPQMLDQNNPTNPTSYRLIISSANNQNHDNLLNVLQVSPMGNCNLQTTSFSSPAGMDGVEIKSAAGNWAVLSSQQTKVIDTSVTYTVTSATHHIVTDLKPNTNYTGTVNVNTNNTGVARFDTAAGVTNITLNPGGQVVAPPPAPAPAPAPAPGPVTAPVVTATKSVDKTTANLGDTLTYTIKVANTGTANASNVVITDPLPANTDFVSASNGGTYSAATGNVSYPGFSLATGANVSYTLTVKVQGGAATTPAPAPAPGGTSAWFTKPSAGATVDQSNALSTNLDLVIPFNEGSGGSIKDAASGNVAQAGAVPFKWVKESTAFTGDAVDFTGATGVGFAASAPIFKNPSIAGYSFAVLYKPNSSAKSALNRTMDTNTTGAFASYLSIFNPGEINLSLRDSNNTALNPSFKFGTTGSPPWILMVTTVAPGSPGTATVYANLKNGTVINDMAVQSTIAADPAKSLASGGQASSYYVAGTGGNFVPQAQIAGEWIWRERVLSNADIKTFYANPFAMLK